MAQVRIRKRGKTYSYIFEAGKVDGKRKVVEKGGFPTKAAAYKAGVAAYNDFLHGNIGITSESISLKDFMTAWLDNVVALNVKASSMLHYQSYVKNHIALQIGEVKVQDLTPALLDKWIRDMQKANYSHNTISENALSFRHTHATRLIEVSTTPEAAACRLGHKNSDLTFETYVHDTPKMQEQVVKLQEETAAIFAQILQTKS